MLARREHVQHAVLVLVVLIFVHAGAARAGAQSFDYADRRDFRGESGHDDESGQVEHELSSYEDSVREISRPTTTQSYATETLAADGVSLALIPAGFSAPGFLLLGVGGYLFGAPVVHLAHGRPLTSIASFGLRLALPPLVGLGLADGKVDDCGEDSGLCLPKAEFVVGFLLGLGGAIALDATVLANEDVPVAEPTGVSVAPRVIVTGHGATGGLVGAF